MRQALAAIVLVGGCSWIYNPNSLGKPTDAKQFNDSTIVDAPIDAPLVRDADPAMLTLIDVEPDVIFGGQGSGNSRPATLLIHGHNFVDGFMVDIQPNTTVHILNMMRSFDGDYLAVQVEADVVHGAGGPDQPLTVMVSEPMAPTQTLTTLKLRNLPTLETNSVDYKTLASTTYALIAIPGTPMFDDAADAEQITFKSISSVTIGGMLSAKGETVSGTGAGTPGAGGCPGGALGTTGGCASTPGGGGGATGTFGGGGGGFVSMGMPGGGGIMGGPMHGNPAILNYTADANHTANQSSGGGGGAGGSLLSGGGGGGGGGGGTIEIDAGGDIMLAGLDVSGGGGGSGSGGLASATGGGGGGTGGVIVLRSASGDYLGSATIAASGGGGGPGGKPIAGGAGGSGGPGADGRIRADVPTAPPTVGSLVPHRNPIFDVSTSTISTVVSPTVKLLGTASELVDLTQYDFDGTNHDGEPKGVMFAPNGVASTEVSLRDGYNKICATLRDGVPGTDLADTCIEIMYLP